MSFKGTLLTILIGTLSSFAAFAAVNYQDIQKALQSPEGLVAEIHGADKDSGLFVLVIRDEENFFDYLQVPLIADYTSENYNEIKKALNELNRHDFVRIKGTLHGWLEAAQRHIMVSSLEMVKKFDGGYGDYPDYKHKAELPKELEGKEAAVVKVHAVASGGKILMVEYRDVNVPVVVTNPSLVKDLYRGDKVRIKFSIASHPKRPTHLVLKSESDAVVVLDSIARQNGQPIFHCGELVMFPKSPQVKFNVFAIKKDIGDDLFRTYTLINFEDVDLFLALRQKAQEAWDTKPETIIRGRNYYVNPGLIACASGTVNMIDPTQANPQIVIERLEDLSFR